MKTDLKIILWCPGNYLTRIHCHTSVGHLRKTFHCQFEMIINALLEDSHPRHVD